jgi:hypothetical protein
MNGPYPVSWILLLLAVLAVFGALAAIIWRSWIAGSVVLLFILLFFGLYFVRAVPSTPSTVMIQETVTRTVEPSEPDIEYLKTANIYSSTEEAARFLTLRLCDDLHRAQPPVSATNIHIVSAKKDAQPPVSATNIHIVNAKKDATGQIISEAFKDEFPGANIITDASPGDDASQLMVTFSVTNSGKTLTLRATQNGQSFRQEANVKEALWVSNFDEFRREKPQEDWIVGSSSMAEPSLEGAKQRARADAALKILPLVTARFSELNPPNMDPNSLQMRLETDLVGRRLIKEDFVQTMRTPVLGTPVYRVAVLVDASPSRLEKLHGSIVSDLHRSNQRVHRFGGGVVGMGLVICLVYLFLNRATRGYFQMNLRLAAFLVLIAGVLMMMLIG